MAARLPRTARAPAAILLVALAVRVGVVVATGSYTPVNDGADYDRLAVLLADGEGFGESVVAPGGGPTALRPPLYPVVVGAIYAVAGHHVDRARLVQAFLGTATVALLGLLAAARWGRRVALVAMALAAVYPPLVVSDTALLSEGLFAALVLAATLAALRRRDAPGWRAGALTGGLLGLAVLTRPVAAVLVLPLVALGTTRDEGSTARGRAAGVVTATALLVVLPWTIRNLVVLDRFVPLTTQAGYHLSGTYNDGARLDDDHPAEWRPANLDPAYARLLAAAPDADEVETERRLRRAVFEYVADHPLYVAEASFWNLVRTLQLDDSAHNRAVVAGELGYGPLAADVTRVAFWIVLAAGVAGACTRAARRAPVALWLVPILLVAANLPLRSSVRFRVPADPFLLLLAALALVAAATRRRR